MADRTNEILTALAELKREVAAVRTDLGKQIVGARVEIGNLKTEIASAKAELVQVRALVQGIAEKLLSNDDHVELGLPRKAAAGGRRK